LATCGSCAFLGAAAGGRSAWAGSEKAAPATPMTVRAASICLVSDISLFFRAEVGDIDDMAGSSIGSLGLYLGQTIKVRPADTQQLRCLGDIPLGDGHRFLGKL